MSLILLLTFMAQLLRGHFCKNKKGYKATKIKIFWY